MSNISVRLVHLVDQIGGPMAALSGIIICVGYGLFVWETLYGPMKPNKATWTVWFVQDGVMATTAVISGIGAAAVMPVVWGVGAGVMLVLCYTRGESKPYEPIEKICLGLSGGAFVLSFVAGPLMGLVATVISACIGGGPTLVKAWKDPTSESTVGWVLMLAATVANMCAIEEWTFKSGFLPVMVGTLQISIALPLVAHSMKTYAETLWASRV